MFELLRNSGGARKSGLDGSLTPQTQLHFHRGQPPLRFFMSQVTSTPSIFVTLLPIMVAVLAGFVIIGLTLPVLPLHVYDDLGYGTLVVELVAGAQFAASLISRIWAGSYSDKHGGKRGVVTGLISAAVSALLYLLSLALVCLPVVSVTILLTVRAMLGGVGSRTHSSL